MKEQIRTFNITIIEDEDGSTINRSNHGIPSHELIGICTVIIAEQTKKLMDQSTFVNKENLDKEMD